MKATLRLTLVLLMLLAPQAAWTQLIDNGDGTISDVDQQIMWMKDAGAAPNMLYPEALAWIDQQNANAFAGYTNWRLPAGTSPNNDPTANSDDGQNYYNARGSEFGYLFYTHLSGLSGCHVSKVGIACAESNDDPDLLLFENIPPQGNFPNSVYWTGMVGGSGQHWSFAFASGVYNARPSGAGDTQGFRGWAVRDASIPTPQCNDGIDNDGDGLTDTADPGCLNTADDDETNEFECSDGIDNDADGFVDGDDRNCCSDSDDSELAQTAVSGDDTPQCSDGIDNDDDCLIDYPEDDLCRAADDPSESARCSRMPFRGWVCLSREIYWIGYVSVALLAIIATWSIYRARQRRRPDAERRSPD